MFISKSHTQLCYCIFESCNGAQEVAGRATGFRCGIDFGSGSTAKAPPGSDPSLFQDSKAGKSLKKGEL